MPKPPAKPPAQVFAASLAEMVRDPAIDATKLETLLRIQRELIADQAREAFQQAFIRLKPALPQINRNGRVLTNSGKLLYRYTKYEDLDAAITPVLNAHGFAISFETVVNGANTVVTGTLMHDGGHGKTSSMVLKPDPGQNRNNLQSDGSGLSYAQRYLTMLLLNLARKGMDDDGTGFGSRPISAEQKEELVELIRLTQTDTKRFLAMMLTGVESLDDIPESELFRLKNALLERQRRQAQS